MSEVLTHSDSAVDTEPTNLIHIACCRDDDRALCGTDLSGACWTSAPLSCVVCDDLVKGKTCPLFGACLEMQ